jgi:opacity protein-like surface antigen
MSQVKLSYRLVAQQLVPVAPAPKQTWIRSAAARLSQAAVAAFALYGTPATAQEQAGAQSVEVYGGELFGDDLTRGRVSGRTPRLDDNAAFGGRYTYNVTDMWGLQLSGGYDPNRASRVTSGNSDLGLTTVDLNALWNINLQGPIVAYVTAGAGYAWANLNSPIKGQDYGRPVVITDSNGVTANAGIGAKCYVTNNLFVDLEARYRCLNRLVNYSSQNLNTVETTLGFGRRF